MLSGHDEARRPADQSAAQDLAEQGHTTEQGETKGIRNEETNKWQGSTHPKKIAKKCVIGSM